MLKNAPSHPKPEQVVVGIGAVVVLLVVDVVSGTTVDIISTCTSPEPDSSPDPSPY